MVNVMRPVQVTDQVFPDDGVSYVADRRGDDTHGGDDVAGSGFSSPSAGAHVSAFRGR
ncbi:hypothetical protein [Rhodococcus sp. (in: high G+C Gram-positive bacteria)]|uniref:hypothetical protein n=1 Tax=Rhodococcus sp. TaxID=1831 RepID=UPI003BAFC235